MNTNFWNKIRYTFYTPIYDWVAAILNESRRKSIESLDIQPGDKVLIVGAGTGLDLEYISPNCSVTATDLTPSMVRQIKKRSRKLGGNVTALVMDGHNLGFKNETFDKVILHLILAVIPDPVACITEAERVLKPGGRMAVYDKFVHKESKVSPIRKMLNVITNLFFSDITRHFEKLQAHTKLVVLSDIPADFGGNFRRIQLKK